MTKLQPAGWQFPWEKVFMHNDRFPFTFPSVATQRWQYSSFPSLLPCSHFPLSMNLPSGQTSISVLCWWNLGNLIYCSQAYMLTAVWLWYAHYTIEIRNIKVPLCYKIYIFSSVPKFSCPWHTSSIVCVLLYILYKYIMEAVLCGESCIDSGPWTDDI